MYHVTGWWDRLCRRISTHRLTLTSGVPVRSFSNFNLHTTTRSVLHVQYISKYIMCASYLIPSQSYELKVNYRYNWYLFKTLVQGSGRHGPIHLSEHQKSLTLLVPWGQHFLQSFQSYRGRLNESLTIVTLHVRFGQAMWNSTQPNPAQVNATNFAELLFARKVKHMTPLSITHGTWLECDSCWSQIPNTFPSPWKITKKPGCNNLFGLD
jgi:hypothetical protein